MLVPRCGWAGGHVALDGAGWPPVRRTRCRPAGECRGGELAAVVHQEARRAGELVRLLRDDMDGELLAGQVRAGQFEGFGEVGLVGVEHASGLGLLSFQLFEAVLTGVGVVTAAGASKSAATRGAPWVGRQRDPGERVQAQVLCPMRGCVASGFREVPAWLQLRQRCDSYGKVPGLASSAGGQQSGLARRVPVAVAGVHGRARRVAAGHQHGSARSVTVSEWFTRDRR